MINPALDHSGMCNYVRQIEGERVGLLMDPLSLVVRYCFWYNNKKLASEQRTTSDGGSMGRPAEKH